MNRVEWRKVIPSVGVLVALCSAFVYYLQAPARTHGVIADLHAVLPIVFGTAAVVLALALVSRRVRPLAHSVAAGALAFYASALWWTAATTGSVYGLVGAGLATSITINALALASDYSRPGGDASWTRR